MAPLTQRSAPAHPGKGGDERPVRAAVQGHCLFHAPASGGAAVAPAMGQGGAGPKCLERIPSTNTKRVQSSACTTATNEQRNPRPVRCRVRQRGHFFCGPSPCFPRPATRPCNSEPTRQLPLEPPTPRPAPRRGTGPDRRATAPGPPGPAAARGRYTQARRRPNPSCAGDARACPQRRRKHGTGRTFGKSGPPVRRTRPPPVPANQSNTLSFPNISNPVHRTGNCSKTGTRVKTTYSLRNPTGRKSPDVSRRDVFDLCRPLRLRPEEAEQLRINYLRSG